MKRIGLCAGLVIFALLAAPGAPARAQQHLTADTAATTAAGASFTAPADWRLTERAALRLLEEHEHTREEQIAAFNKEMQARLEALDRGEYVTAEQAREHIRLRSQERRRINAQT